jgi:transcriptional regulator with XRE-family HTH domain
MLGTMVKDVLKKKDHVQSSEHHSDQRAAVKPRTFGQRLRQERDRLGLSQADFAERGGVRRTTQHIYESDTRVPDLKYLERVQEAGADLAYLVLGERLPVGRHDTLTLSYAALSNIYRVVDEFCRGDGGTPLPLDSRLLFFQLLCASVKDRGSSDAELDSLRSELARFTGT